MDPRLFHRRLYESTRRLLPREARVLCAVSGGPDSMALLRGLIAVNEIRERGWSLGVAHLDHGMYEGSEDAAKFVRKTAESMGLPFWIERRVIPELRREGESAEEAARRVRYSFLEEAAEAAGARYVAVGHQADDQAETILFRILRGTGLRGLGGMASRRVIRKGSEVAVVRPLLGFRRGEILEYLKRQEWPYWEDPTNGDEAVSARNRLRGEIIPFLEARTNPRLAEALVGLGRRAAEAESALRRIALTELNEGIVHRSGDRLSLSVASLGRLPLGARSVVLAAALERMGLEGKQLTSERLGAVRGLLGRSSARREIELAGGVMVERRGGELIIVRGSEPDPAVIRAVASVRGVVGEALP